MSKILRVVLETLTCGGKTEYSEDEVYAVVAGANTASGAFNSIFPGSDSEWSMDDHGEKRELNVNRTLYFGAVPEGSETMLTITLRERDGSSPGKIIAGAASAGMAVAGVLAGSKDVADVGKLVAAAITEAIPNDTDDWLGTISLSVQNSQGKVALRWVPGERATLRSREEERKFQEVLFSSPWSPLRNLPASLKATLLAKALARYGATPNDSQQVAICTGDGGYYWAYVRADVVNV